ncbi:DEAD/DEAH box helicase family protein [Paenibacillus sp. FSL H8-0317]|uniref:DEAD/DEAH box helicase n=1 Tax=Paenibacillus sp. FSL H8-0317 TaxID=2921385 RepID=UPI003250CAF6
MNLNYFIESIPKIENNPELREPQVLAYQKLVEHFVVDKSREHAIVVLPTGVGKTGLMGILPFGISFGRVLIVTPQLVIKDAVLDSLDPEHPKNFWLTRNVFDDYNDLPSVIEYDSKTSMWALEQSNIVILNVQKLQERLDSSLINKVETDFFDMIIIDEAHHSTAPTWENSMNYFSEAKVIKVTGTPYRTDGEEIKGVVKYKYPLSQAMANNYVKSLERITYVPDQLFFTINKKNETLYSLDQIRAMNLKDEDWISLSVAFSEECNVKVIDESLSILEEKRSTGVPHKIIAVACSIFHAEEIQKLYEDRGQSVALIHSKVSKDELSRRLKMIENHSVQVVVHVAKLGEGYDHKYLSVAAIFRPFRNKLPYEQFVGRVLRSIDPNEVRSPEDNIACVVHHKELGLEDLWKFYKEEKEKSEVIKYIGTEDDLITEKAPRKKVEKATGNAYEEGNGLLEKDHFIDTELIKERERRQAEEAEKVRQLKGLLPDIPDDALLQIVRRQEEGSPSARILRPDKFLYRQKRSLDDRIKKEMVPELILNYNIPMDGLDLRGSSLFKNRKYQWMPVRIPNNAGMIAAYLEHRVNELVGNSDRNSWSPPEYESALVHVEELFDLVKSILDSEFKK